MCLADDSCDNRSRRDVVYEMNDLCEYDTLGLEGTPDGVRVVRMPLEPSEGRWARLDSGSKHPAGDESDNRWPGTHSFQAYPSSMIIADAWRANALTNVLSDRWSP
jgi:hypothetical protein